jgi:hypothetical protein
MGKGCVESIYRIYTEYSEPTKLLYNPKQQPRREGGLRQIKHLPPNPITGQFLRKDNP